MEHPHFSASVLKKNKLQKTKAYMYYHKEYITETSSIHNVAYNTIGAYN